MQDVKTSATAWVNMDHCPSVAAGRIHRMINSIFDEASRPHGLSVSQVVTLLKIKTEDGIIATDIGRDLLIDKSTLSRNMKRLVKNGLITIEQRHGRLGSRIHLTELALSKLAKIEPAWRIAEGRAKELLGPHFATLLKISGELE